MSTNASPSASSSTSASTVTPNAESSAAGRIDVRLIPSSQRHPVIFHRFESLPAGASMELLCDHEPLPLRQQIEAQWPGQSEWQAVQTEPLEWRVKVTRKSSGSSCCGCCSGSR